MNAWLVFVDESGPLMRPLVRRSWKPRGQTPVLVQRRRRLDEVSALAALCVSPSRDRVWIYNRLHTKAEIAALQVVDFLRHSAPFCT